jgi:hypothetical protein
MSSYSIGKSTEDFDLHIKPVTVGEKIDTQGRIAYSLASKKVLLITD